MAKRMKVRPSAVSIPVRLLEQRKLSDGISEVVLQPLTDKGRKSLANYKGIRAILCHGSKKFGLKSVCASSSYLWTCAHKDPLPDTATLQVCMGRGLFAVSEIPLGSRFSYVGNVVTPDEIAVKKHSSYLLTLPCGLIVDGQAKGGMANYCNHGGPKNKNAYIDVDSVRENPNGTVRVDAVTARTIRAGEEILLDYNGRGGCAPHTYYFPDKLSPNLADAIAFNHAHSRSHRFAIGDRALLARGVRDDESRTKHKKWHPWLDLVLLETVHQCAVFSSKTGLPEGCTWCGKRLQAFAKNERITLPLPFLEHKHIFYLCAPDGRLVGDGVEILQVRIAARFAPDMYVLDYDGAGTLGYAEGRVLMSSPKENARPTKRKRTQKLRPGDKVVVASVRDPTTNTFTASYEGAVAWVRADGRYTVASENGIFVDSGVAPSHVTLRDGGEQKRCRGISADPLMPQVPPLVILSALQRGGERRLLARAGGRTRWIGATAHRNGWLRNGVRVAWAERTDGGWVYRSGTLRGHRAPFSVWRDDYPASWQHEKTLSKKEALQWRLNYVEWLGAARSCPFCGVSGVPCTKECRKEEAYKLNRYFKHT